MQQKIIKVGNSLAITIPSSFVKERKIKAGQKMFVHVDSDRDMIFIRSTKRGISGITPEFKLWLEKFINSYAHTLKELANR